MKPFVLFALIVLLGCSPGKENKYKKYYFPYEDYTEPVTYYYKDSNGDTTVWEMSYNEQDHEFKTQVLLPNNTTEVTTENITEEGAYFTSFVSIEEGGNIKNAELLDNEVFFWDLDDDQTITWSIRYNYSDSKETTTKVRSLSNSSLTISFNDKEYDAIEFEDKYEIAIDYYDRPNEKINFVQRTIYAEGIGIYSTVREFEDGEVYSSTLFKIER